MCGSDGGIACEGGLEEAWGSGMLVVGKRWTKRRGGGGGKGAEVEKVDEDEK